MKNNQRAVMLGMLTLVVFVQSAAAFYTENCIVSLYIHGKDYARTPYSYMIDGPLKADVYINDEHAGKTSGRRFTVKPGEVEIVIKKEGYAEYTIPKFTCKDNAYFGQIEVVLEPTGCTLVFSSRIGPYASTDGLERCVNFCMKNSKIYLDGSYIGDYRHKHVPIFTPGLHTIEAYRWGHTPATATFNCLRGEVADVKLTLGYAKEYCNPRIRFYEIAKDGKERGIWANLYVDGLDNGVIRNKNIRFEAGKQYNIEGRKDGYISESYLFDCKPGDKSPWDITLTKKQGY